MRISAPNNYKFNSFCQYPRVLTNFGEKSSVESNAKTNKNNEIDRDKFVKSELQAKETSKTQDAINSKKQKVNSVIQNSVMVLGLIAFFVEPQIFSLIDARTISKALKIKKLPENIVFKEAKTLEEAIAYAKDVLKIKSVDKGFTLEALNWVNEGLTHCSNMQKGNAKMPLGLTYQFEEWTNTSKTIASITSRGEEFCYFNVEKRLFEHKELEKLVDKMLYTEKNLNYIQYAPQKWRHVSNSSECLDKKLGELVGRYYQNKPGLSVLEKRQILWGLKEASVEFNYSGIKFRIYSPNDGLKTVYHEQGHLQDMALNYEALDKEAQGCFIRWGTDEIFKPEDIDSSTLLQIFFEEKNKKIVGKVSEYAQCGIGEFIAETYAKLMCGKKLDKDVLDLYKYFNGPKIARIPKTFYS